MVIFGSIMALILGSTTLVLQIYSLKSRNPFFVKSAKRLLTIALCIVLIPTILLCFIQEDHGKLILKNEMAELAQAREANKLFASITLRWKAGIVTDHAQLAAMTATIDNRLRRASRAEYKVESNFDKISAYTTISSTSPTGFERSKLYMIINEAVNPTLGLQPRHPYATFPATESYEEIFSVRSVHPGQERMAQSGYPDAPDNHTRLPWKDGFVYVTSNAFHINDQSILTAQRYHNNGLLLTLTPEGMQSMQNMVFTLSQMQMKVAVLYKNKVRGVYDPQICVSDQLLINDIPETPQQIDLDADMLSHPRGFGDVSDTDFGYIYPIIESKLGFPRNLYMTLASEKYDKLWVIVFAFLMLAVSLGLWYLHARTRPQYEQSKF